jgi:protoporphyrinogen/coproporphyrinogen III oxidase
MADVAVIGGGVSGLSAAYELTRHGVTFELFEQAPVCGGVVVTDQVAGYTIDAGPDSLLTQKPAAIALCGELGLTARLQSLRTRETHVLRGGRLRQLPPTSVFGLPTRWLPFVTTDAFSWPDKVRMAASAAPRVTASPNRCSPESMAATRRACRCVRDSRGWSISNRATAA